MCCHISVTVCTSVRFQPPRDEREEVSLAANPGATVPQHRCLASLFSVHLPMCAQTCPEMLLEFLTALASSCGKSSSFTSKIIESEAAEKPASLNAS